MLISQHSVTGHLREWLYWFAESNGFLPTRLRIPPLELIAIHTECFGYPPDPDPFGFRPYVFHGIPIEKKLNANGSL